MMLKTYLFNRLCASRLKLISLVKIGFFSLCFIISMHVISGPKQQIDDDIFLGGINYFSEPDRWVFKELDQPLVPEKLGNGKVLLVIESSFFTNKNQDEELGLSSTTDIDTDTDLALDAYLDIGENQDKNINRIMESYMVVSMIRMLRKKEVEQIFIDYNNLLDLNEEHSDLDAIDKLTSPLLDVKMCDIYVGTSFEKSMLNYAAVGEFTTGNSSDEAPVCKIKYNPQKNSQNQKNTYLNLCDATKYTKNDIDSETNHVDMNATEKVSGSKETVELYDFNKHSHEHVETIDEEILSVVSIKPKKKRKTYEGIVRGSNELCHLNKRIFLHDTGTLYKCDICSKKFMLNSELTAHLINHARKEPYECNACDKEFYIENALQQHLKTHTGEQPYECDVCGMKFFAKSSLNRHLKLHTGEKPYECDLCATKCVDKDRLTRHLKTHTGKKPHVCNVCGMKFITKSSLNRHLKLHTGEKPYECDVCAKKFVDNDRLTRHMHSHTNEKNYGCNMCEKAFREKYALQQHLKTHTGERNYECDVCGIKFLVKSSLNRHLKIHTGEKPYECDLCAKNFLDKDRLTRHRHIHTREKNYGCNMCEKEFRRKDALQYHMKSHTGEKPYECSVCAKNFSTMSNLTHHKRHIHK
ncbi:MAG: C2H2-type zinc finger protein [Candidatus Endonucleobacter bathymodioli]|uniref:C2H2-type zinc finger protein n=1 Tax=Candidatus Endonucleibacter bathymodioli TaxID=539814 RepID=A0AA90NVN9_9GAMM|nr:C2H2-type zinc finger protein [Candidatus Endonucleobacter bathymodioli]